MNNNDKTFEQGPLDEQLNYPVDLLASDEQRLMQDLQHAYHSYEQENTQSLQLVWMRLERQRQHTHGETRTASISSLQRKQKMKNTSSSSHASRSSIKSTLSLIAAVLVVAVLVGSAFFIFRAAGQNTPASRGGNHMKPQPTDTSVVNSSPGTYIEYMPEQNKVVLAKLDAKTHKPVWTFPGNDLNFGCPVVYGDTVFLNGSRTSDAINQSHMIALSATTGKLLWDTPFKVILDRKSGPGDLIGFTTPVASNGLVFVTDYTGTVFAFDATTGKQKWTYETGASAVVRTYSTDPTTGKQKLVGIGAPAVGAPQVSNGVLYGALGKTLYAINIQTGKQVWISKLTSQDQMFSYVQIIDGVIYASSSSLSQNPISQTQQHIESQTYKSYMYAFNAKNGKQNWNYALQSRVPEFAIDSGHIYFVALNPSWDSRDAYSTLYALTLQGKKAWEHDYRNQIVPLLTAGNGYVSVSGGIFDQGKPVSNTLYVMKADGQNAWQKDVMPDSISIEDGVLYTTSGLKIIAYDLTSQHELWHVQYGEDVVDKEGSHSYLGWVVIVP